MQDNAVIISLNDVCKITSLSRTAINNLRNKGAFPKEVRLGEKRFGFLKSEVFAWLDERIAARAA